MVETMKTDTTPRQQQARRRFLNSVVAGGGLLGLGLLGFIPVYSHAPRLRPPGALDEDPFLASCIKCGQCVQVCPVEAIKLADLTDGFGLGVPYIAARDQACDFSCDALQCILACPTGALSHQISHKEEVRMGLAKLSRPEACLARLGQGFKGVARGPDYPGLLRYAEIDRWNPLPVREHPYDLELCDLCVRQCPIENAIRLVPLPSTLVLSGVEASSGNGEGRTPEVLQACVGCGVCEMICPVEPAAIVIEPRQTWESA
jgi:ferredoxin-type protein NapG